MTHYSEVTPLNTEKKLNHFREISIQAADSQSSDILDKYKAGLDEIFDNHRKEAETAAQSALETKKAIIRKNIKKEVADTEAALKREVTLKANSYKEQLFKEVELKLSDFRKTGDYFNLLTALINDCQNIADGDEMEVYIDEDDSDLKNSLSDASDADIKINDFKFGGGIRAVIPSKNILIDETFETKISEIKDDYRINC